MQTLKKTPEKFYLLPSFFYHFHNFSSGCQRIVQIPRMVSYVKASFEPSTLSRSKIVTQRKGNGKLTKYFGLIRVTYSIITGQLLNTPLFEAQPVHSGTAIVQDVTLHLTKSRPYRTLLFILQWLMSPKSVKRRTAGLSRRL